MGLYLRTDNHERTRVQFSRQESIPVFFGKKIYQILCARGSPIRPNNGCSSILLKCIMLENEDKIG